MGLGSGISGGWKAGEASRESGAKFQKTSLQLIPPFVSHADPLSFENATFSDTSSFPCKARETSEEVGAL